MHCRVRMDVIVSRACSLMDSDPVKSHTYVLHGMNLKTSALKIPNRYVLSPITPITPIQLKKPSFSLQWHTRLKVDKHYMY